MERVVPSQACDGFVLSSGASSVQLQMTLCIAQRTEVSPSTNLGSHLGGSHRPGQLRGDLERGSEGSGGSLGAASFCHTLFSWDRDRLAWNLQSSCLSFPDVGITDVSHHAWLCRTLACLEAL
jgi:hypothetical protein